MSESPEQILNVAASPVTVVRQEHIILALQKMLLREIVNRRLEAFSDGFRYIIGHEPTQKQCDEAEALLAAQVAHDFDQLVLQIAKRTG